MLTIEQRLLNLENLVHALSQKIDNNKYYTDADMQGNRQSISDITPYTDQKNAYIGDTEVLFTGVPAGKLSVFIEDSEGNYPNYTIERINDRVTISFSPLEYVATITISVS